MKNKIVFVFFAVAVVALVTMLLILLSLPEPTGASPDPDWLDNWDYRKEITILDSKVDDNLDNFPVLIEITLENSKVLDNADDVRFTENDGTTLLNYEIEYFDTENLIAHVRFPNLYDNENVKGYIYYGNSDAPNGENATGVWDSNFKMVQHMADNTTSSIEDSTSNNNDGTKSSADHPVEADGKIGKGQDYTPNDNIETTPSDPGDIFTIEAWIKLDDNSASRGIFGSTYYNPFCHFTPHRLGICANASESWTLSSVDSITTGTWYYVAFVANGMTRRIYINGSQDGYTANTNYNPNWGSPQYIGRAHSEYWNGIMDEVRLSDVERSAGWISTSYNNQNSPSTFYSVGSEESAPTEQWNQIETWTGAVKSSENVAPSLSIVFAGKNNENWLNHVRMPDNYMEVKVSASDASGLENVILEWYDNGSWDNYEMDSIGGDNYLENMTGLENGREYSFNVWAVDFWGNKTKLEWKYTDNTGQLARKFIGANYTIQSIEYTIYYFVKAHYSGSGGGHLEHEQDVNLAGSDLTYLSRSLPDEHLSRWCEGWVQGSMNENLTIPYGTKIDNVYVHVWWNANVEQFIWSIYFKSLNTGAGPQAKDEGVFNDWYITSYENARAHYEDISGFYYDNFYLEASYFDLENEAWDDIDSNDIYQFQFYLDVAGYNIEWITSLQATSFIILNIPDNTTLQGMDSDSDGLNDYQELYENYTNPFQADTDFDDIQDNEDNEPLFSNLPALYSPENGTMVGRKPTLTWKRNIYIDTHRLLVDNDSDFSSPTENKTFTTENSYTFSTELAVDNYWWKIVPEPTGVETATWVFEAYYQWNLIESWTGSIQTINEPPSVENLYITDTDNNPESDLIPETQYKFWVEIEDNENLSDIENVTLVLYLDNENLPDAPENHYTFQWTKENGFEEIGDPNFGCENIGSGVGTMNNVVEGSTFTCPEAGTANSITCYLTQYLSETPNVAFAIYKESNGSLVGYTENWTLTSGWNGWKTLDLVWGGTLEANTDYILCFWASGNMSHRDNDFVGGKRYIDEEIYDYPNFPNPHSKQYPLDKRISIYCTYTSTEAKHLVVENCENFDNTKTTDNIVFAIKLSENATLTDADNWDAYVEVWDSTGNQDNRFFLNRFDVVTGVQWNLIETWTGAVEAPAAWGLIEQWTGSIEAPVAWQLIETWTGTIETPVGWQLIETWTGTIEAYAEWNLIEQWSGTVQAPAQWDMIETWTGTVKAPVAWTLIETWTGNIEAYSGWVLMESWSGSVEAYAEWHLIENWTGIVEAPAAWQLIETWTGTVETLVEWQLIESWTGNIEAYSGWVLMESWSGSIEAFAEWGLIETWTGAIETPAQWGLVESWSGTLIAPVAWELVETWSGAVEAFSGWQLIETWSGAIQTPAGWLLIESWSGSVLAYAEWHEIESWTGTVYAVGWKLIETWDGAIHSFGWGLIETWTGSIETPAVYAVAVSIVPENQSGILGDTLEFTVFVINIGAQPDTYHLDADDFQGWAVYLYDNDLGPISSGDNENTVLNVGLTTLGTHTITVTATSQGDNSVSHADNCTAISNAQGMLVGEGDVALGVALLAVGLAICLIFVLTMRRRRVGE